MSALCQERTSVYAAPAIAPISLSARHDAQGITRRRPLRLGRWVTNSGNKFEDHWVSPAASRRLALFLSFNSSLAGHGLLSLPSIPRAS
jgi:hypothetical protein